MKIQVKGLTKKFGNFTALEDVDLTLESGELVALLGPSGCGKTTLLRVFSGLEVPDSGTVLFGDQDQTRVSIQDRKVGFVFQHYALFRHMSIFENVAFGLRAKPRKERPAEEEIQRRVHELLSLVQLEGQAHKFPDQLSGGQRQRVALARSLIVQPKVLLLDEPFGALDANVRRDLRRWLRRLHDELGITTILVTHDQEEALEVADRVVLMNKGQIVQTGTPEEIYLRPANAFVYEFLGSVNVFHGRLTGEQFSAMPTSGDASPRYIRPHEISVRLEKRYAEDLEGTIRRLSFTGPFVRLEVDLKQDISPSGQTGSLIEGQTCEAAVTQEEYQRLGLRPGLGVYLGLENYRTFLGEGI